MLKKIIRRAKSEQGNITILFAFFLVIIIFFVGLSIDIGMIYMKKNELISLCQIVKDSRYTYQDNVRYSDNPGLETFNIVEGTLDNNNFDGEIEVYFFEELPAYNYREYKVRTILTTEYSYTFLKLFGGTTIPISASIDGGENYGEGIADVIWYPPNSVNEYNGLYKRDALGSHSFKRGVKPSDW